MQDFVHLHNHTHYSLLDAACTPEQLIKAAAADNQKALALTDHGVMYGAKEFHDIALANGVKPLIGCEVYIAKGSRFEKSKKKGEKHYYHLILIAKDLIGYKNLVKLTSIGYLEGFYYRPRIDREVLEKYSEGLICSSACLAGEVNAHLKNQNYEKAREAAQYYNDLFGDDFYLEMQDHEQKDDKIIMRDIPRLAKELDIKYIATNDIHYEKFEHALAHNVLQLIKDGKGKYTDDEIKKLRYGTPELYFKTRVQMNELFEDYPEALSNTLEIADKCDFTFQKKLFMPEFPIPEAAEADNLDDYLIELTNKGLEERYDEITPEIRERADFELKVIIEMGFPGYFLIVQDFVQAARDMGVSVGPGRGSAAGSLVAYALKITNVDPLKYDLLFERFLNPERVSMPDIDIDFSDETREKVVQYCKDKYGEDAVAKICSFGKLSSRLVLKDVGRVLGIPHTEINEITKKIPVVQGKVTKLKDALELADLRYVKESRDEKMQNLIRFSLVLENFYRNVGTHPAGVVIAPGPVSDYVPLYKAADKGKEKGDIATQFSMNDLESAGLLKMDFLGLRTLSIIDHALEEIDRNHGKKIDIDQIPLDDKKTYDLLSEGRTFAVFQFESSGMQACLKQLKPRRLEDITAMNALYRPGPVDNIPTFIERKNKGAKVDYIHPIMEKTLAETFGIIVYQEQVMQLARDIGGFSLGEADVLRRAMGKKKFDVMEKMKPRFMDGAAERGIDSDKALEIFELIEKFAKYGFNKSHALVYSYVAYQTAYLKANYPSEFLAANMSAENELDAIVPLIEEAAGLGIQLVPPDVNRSGARFTAKGDQIYFGLAAIKGVGESAVESIIRAREDGPFKSFFDFASRVSLRHVKKNAMEALICAGAFDNIEDGRRAAFFESIETALGYAKAMQNQTDSSMSLFGDAEVVKPTEPKLPEVDEWSQTERLKREKNYLSFFISGNPIDDYRPLILGLNTVNLGEPNGKMIGGEGRVAGLISNVRLKRDKKDNGIAFATVENFDGKAECKLWSKTYEKYQDRVKKDSIVCVVGKTESDGEKIEITVNEMYPIEFAAQRFGKKYVIGTEKSDKSVEKIRQLKNLCGDSSNAIDIELHLISGDKNSGNGSNSIWSLPGAAPDFSIETLKKLARIFGKKVIVKT